MRGFFIEKTLLLFVLFKQLCVYLSKQNKGIMNVEQGRELRNQLQEEIDKGIDVDFNTEWIKVLNKSILKAVEKGLTKSFKKYIN